MLLGRCQSSIRISYGTILKSDVMIEIEVFEWLGSALIVGAIVLNFCYREVKKKKNGKDKIRF